MNKDEFIIGQYARIKSNPGIKGYISHIDKGQLFKKELYTIYIHVGNKLRIPVESNNIEIIQEPKCTNHIWELIDDNAMHQLNSCARCGEKRI